MRTLLPGSRSLLVPVIGAVGESHSLGASDGCVELRGVLEGALVELESLALDEVALGGG